MAGKRGDKGLTPKQEAFAQHYVTNGGNASEAYRQCYDVKPDASKNSIHVCACKVLANPKVSVRVAELQATVAAKHGVTIDRIVSELATLGFSNMQDYMKVGDDGVPRLDFKGMTRERSSAISEMTVEEFLGKQDGEESPGAVRKVKFKLYDKRAALVDLGKHLGMFKDITELTGKNGAPIQIEPVNDVESARRIAYALGKVIGKQMAAVKQDEPA